jgi:hypothetical protein
VAFAGRPIETDLAPGAWVAAALAPVPPAGPVVASLVPPAFPSCARVFHPATRYVRDDDVDVPWAAVAAANGTASHPLMQWGSITGSMEYFSNDDQAPLWHGPPARGHLPVTVGERLAVLLRRHTGTPDDCWFGVWEGHGNPTATAPSLALPRGPVWLVRGPVELAAANFAEEPGEQSATVWWPADRAWYVATDPDLVTTYVAGGPACIADLLAADGLETAPARPEERVTWDADQVNPWPEDPPIPGADG